VVAGQLLAAAVLVARPRAALDRPVARQPPATLGAAPVMAPQFRSAPDRTVAAQQRPEAPVMAAVLVRQPRAALEQAVARQPPTAPGAVPQFRSAPDRTMAAVAQQPPAAPD
jgi:hypothetical protein